MTRTDTDVKSTKIGPSRRRVSLRRLLALPLALVLLAVLAASALATEPTSNYTHPTTSKQEVLPSKNKTTPQKETAPSNTGTTPKTSTEPTATTAKASTLPFTGLNLSWVVGFGLLLIVAGGSIVMVQRRQRGGGSR